MHNQIRDTDVEGRRAWYVQIGLTIWATGSILMQEIFFSVYSYPWGAAAVRPLLVLTLFRTLRQYCFQYLATLYDSIAMVLFIIAYNIYFSWIGQKIFAGTLQGTLYMSNFGNSFYNMFVLMTTSNYPDVMLPAYQMSRMYFIFFGTYLILGLFLIMNLLLAIIYSNFKARFE